jgi:tetratricopeptide (TPR) repeat protein
MKAAGIFNCRLPIPNFQLRPHGALGVGYWVLGLLAAFGGEAPAQNPIAKLLGQAKAWSNDGRKHADALRACEEVIASPQATKDQKVEAFDLVAASYRGNRKFAELIQTLDRLRAAFPDDKAVAAKALGDQLAVYLELGKNKEGLDKAAELVKVSPDDKPTQAKGELWLARFLRRTEKLKECYDEAKRATELDPQDDKVVAEALQLMADAAWSKGDVEKCLDASNRFLDPKYLGQRPEYELSEHLRRPGMCLQRLQRYEEAAAHFLKVEKVMPNRRSAQETCYLAGRASLEGAQYDPALKTFERVFTDYPEIPDPWYSTQTSIVDALRKQGKFDEALQAARICLDAAPERGAIAANSLLIAELFRATDGHVARANQMINFQRYGPAGEDGKAGTPDDLKDPLAPLPRPAYPDRERAFAEARKKAGDTAQASRYRALTYIYTGHPKEALQCFLDAFARSTGEDYRALGQDLIVIGARAVRGHAIGLKEFVDYVNCGPAGPDGKPGTADDLKDPFAPLLK